ncbi:hypothetical protein PRK78_004716 [Emydomyces testavorans]|uniref:Protein kinase domain-containing protein n=1 Tax=Emydomyces testavorans TaxID=2070801 RepID=A0AAF0IJV0_9EURO|nr:hypothetical protein PRK78_004716 [Emydomyces testavorans]
MSDYGDFPDPDTTEYDDLAEDTEGWEKYTPLVTRNVFYPICLGEVLNQRYRLEHKLGHGGYSTVWMAHDLQNRTDVALKILAEGLGENEYHMQKEIVKAVRDISHLITYLDTFILSGRPDGNDHRVLVYSLHGPSLSMYTVQKKSMITRMSAARQLLQALKSLHNSGIVHHDLNPGNCMWGMISLNQLDRDVKYKILGRPRKLAIDHTWRPGELVKAVDIPEDLCTDAFYLGDFGLSLKLGTSVTESGFPPARYRSPDRDFNQPPSAACDIWSYMSIANAIEGPLLQP